MWQLSASLRGRKVNTLAINIHLDGEVAQKIDLFRSARSWESRTVLVSVSFVGDLTRMFTCKSRDCNLCRLHRFVRYQIFMHRSIRLGFSDLYKTNKQQQQTNKQTKTVSNREHEPKETDITHHEGPLFLNYFPCATWPESRDSVSHFLTQVCVIGWWKSLD